MIMRRLKTEPISFATSPTSVKGPINILNVSVLPTICRPHNARTADRPAETRAPFWFIGGLVGPPGRGATLEWPDGTAAAFGRCVSMVSVGRQFNARGRGAVG